MKPLSEYIEACKKKIFDIAFLKTEREAKAIMATMVQCGAFAYGNKSRTKIAM